MKVFFWDDDFIMNFGFDAFLVENVKVVLDRLDFARAEDEIRLSSFQHVF